LTSRGPIGVDGLTITAGKPPFYHVLDQSLQGSLLFLYALTASDLSSSTTSYQPNSDLLGSIVATLLV
jgi:hypothetical protein